MRQLDIIVPCYNPLSNWAEIIIENLNSFKIYLPFTEIHLYLINDGSSSGINLSDIELLKSSLANFTYISYHKNRGKGYALRKGVELATHEYCIYTDVDFPYQQESFARLYNALTDGHNDVVIGVRDSSYYKNITGLRSLLSKLLKFLNTNIFRLSIDDTQCGIKGFNRKGRDIFLKTSITRYLVDLEFIFLATRIPQVKIESVKVKLRAGVTARAFNLRILTMEGISYLKIIGYALSRIIK